MKILITGITGLIGKHVMHVLLKNQLTNIRGHYFSSKNINEYISKNIEMVQADITDKNAIHNITNSCNIVVHTAARVIDFGTKKQFYDAHYEATKFLLEDAINNKVEHFIYISSVGVASGIDRNKIIPNEATSLVKTGILYDDVKIDTEELVKNMCNKNHMHYTIIRPTAVIGIGSVWVNEPLKRMDTSLGLKLIDNGKHAACLLDAENLANGIYLCITKEIARNQIYFFMDDWNISWKKYFTDLANMKGKKLSGSMPYSLAYFIASIAEIIFPLFGKKPPLAKKSAQATGKNRTVSTQKARSELGWTSAKTYEQCMQEIKESL